MSIKSICQLTTILKAKEGILKKIKTKLLLSSKDSKNSRETENNTQAK